MKYVTYRRPEPPGVDNGRDGHVLKDLFSSVIVGELTGLQVVYRSDSWCNQRLLENVPAEEEIDPTEVIHLDRGLDGADGTSFEAFSRMARTMEEAPEGSLLVLEDGFRVQLHRVHQWEDIRLIPEGSTMRCIDRLRMLHLPRRGEAVSGVPVDVVSIHLRRGDVAERGSKYFHTMGPGRWSTDLVQKWVDAAHDVLGPSEGVVVYSELENSDDLLGLTGCLLELGDEGSLKRHFIEMVSSKYLIPTCSSLSTWASYLSWGTVLVPPLWIKHFEHPAPLPWFRDLKQVLFNE